MNFVLKWLFILKQRTKMHPKLLQSEVFKIRYIDRNGFDSPQNLFSHEKKLKIHAQIKQSPIKAIYLAPYLLARSFFKKIHACRHSKFVKQKLRANPAKALYLVPYYLLAKLTFAKSWDKIYPPKLHCASHKLLNFINDFIL